MRDPASQFTVSLTPPAAADFVQLRADCGWGTISQDTAKRALSNSLIDVTLTSNGQVAGFGRVVGDGVLYFYLQDIIVAPQYRGQSAGKLIVQTLLDHIKTHAPNGATIGLMSAHGKESFYAAFGFAHRPSETTGAGMTLVLSK